MGQVHFLPSHSLSLLRGPTSSPPCSADMTFEFYVPRLKRRPHQNCQKERIFGLFNWPSRIKQKEKISKLQTVQFVQSEESQYSMKVPIISPDTPDGDKHYKPPSLFPIGPHFLKYENNPILKPNPDNEFEEAYIYNAAAIVLDDMVFLLYRAQNRARTLSVGLAWLTDGYNFRRYHKPILYPTEPWEQGGGCEDPRIVRDPVSKKFIMTYTAYDRHLARLCVAESMDLLHWKKHPPVIRDDNWSEICNGLDGSQFIRTAWLKSGAVFVDKHWDGNYYMIWGESGFYFAKSDDLVNWRLVSSNYSLSLYTVGKFNWQDRLIEPGPAPIKIENGNKHQNHYILFYNSSTTGAGQYPRATYTISQMLVDYDNLQDGPLARLEKPILVPERPNEVTGQVNQVVFTEGIVQFKGKWFLYYGQGDSELGVATCPA